MKCLHEKSSREVFTKAERTVRGSLWNQGDAVMRKTRWGLVQSPLVTHAMTQDVLEMCDEIRRQWGLVYPFEQHRA